MQLAMPSCVRLFAQITSGAIRVSQLRPQTFVPLTHSLSLFIGFGCPDRQETSSKPHVCKCVGVTFSSFLSSLFSHIPMALSDAVSRMARLAVSYSARAVEFDEGKNSSVSLIVQLEAADVH